MTNSQEGSALQQISPSLWISTEDSQFSDGRSFYSRNKRCYLYLTCLQTRTFDDIDQWCYDLYVYIFHNISSVSVSHCLYRVERLSCHVVLACLHLAFELFNLSPY